MNLGLDGKVSLVCGGSRGLGRAIAEELAAEGASVALCSRDTERLEAAAAELDALALPADLSVAGEPTRVVEATVERLGKLDVLVANTGGPPAGTHDTLTLEDWDRATALLLRSTVELATAALPGMKERGWGRILAVTSVAVKQPVDNLILSNSLRAAVTGFAKTLSREVAPHGITVNTILPGYTATERVTELNRANAEREGVDPPRSRLAWRRRSRSAAWPSRVSSRRWQPSSPPTARATSRAAHSPSTAAGCAGSSDADVVPRQIRYADSDGVQIAYEAFGTGPRDLVLVHGWVTNLELIWEHPRVARALERLGSFCRVLNFDKRGTGSLTGCLSTGSRRWRSGWTTFALSWTPRAAPGPCSSATLRGGPMSVLFAAAYPERVEGLVLYGTFATRRWHEDYPWAPTPEERERHVRAVREGWGGIVHLSELAPGVMDDQEFRDWWARYLRSSASPAAAAALHEHEQRRRRPRRAADDPRPGARRPPRG